MNQYRRLVNVPTRLWCSVHEFPVTVDESQASVDKFGIALENLRTTVDEHQAIVDRHWITVDGQVVSGAELRTTVDIFRNSIDEHGYTSHECIFSFHLHRIIVYQYKLRVPGICSLDCVVQNLFDHDCISR